MGFGDLKNESGVKVLNEYLSDKSYIVGYQPSQADVAVIEALSGVPKGNFEHALRWYNQIFSYGSDKSSFPGSKKSVNDYGPAGQLAAASSAADEDEDDDDFELFGSDDEEDNAEAEKIKQQRIDEYAAKKTKKPTIIAKSNIILDVKPWDDETEMAKLEECVRSIKMDGLLWGSSKFVPVGYGIKKLQISCVVEDDKVSTETLEEKITAFEDYIQSMDIAAFNKV